MTEQHRIAPPLDLVQEWREQAPSYRDRGVARENWLMERAAQWGADYELDACCEWLKTVLPSWCDELRAARRPKPPSLKQEALDALQKALVAWMTNQDDKDMFRDYGTTIRRALEALPDD